MGAFNTVKIPGGFRFTEPDGIEPGPPHHPGNYRAENSNRPLVFPWGKPTRNVFFIGPHEMRHTELPLGC